MVKLAKAGTKTGTSEKQAAKEPVPTGPANAPFENMVWIPGGTFLMGSDRHYPEESPVHQETVAGFWMDKYLTVAERVPDAAQYPGALPHMLVAGSVVFRQASQRVDLRNHLQLVDLRAGRELAPSHRAGEFLDRA